MPKIDMPRVVTWLRDNCSKDEPLLELIDLLEGEGRHDLLLLMHAFRLPPYRLDSEINTLVGSAEAVERGLCELEQVFRPIGEKHHALRMLREGEQSARDFYRHRLCSGLDRKACEVLVEDPLRDIPEADRLRFRTILKCSAEQRPVAIEELPGRLGLASVTEVIQCLSQLRGHFRDRRPTRDVADRADRRGRGRS
jgi:hypothetical protein